MKTLIYVAVFAIAASTISSCSGVRSASGPAGPVTPGAGSASDLASGRNATGTPIGNEMATAAVEASASTAEVPGAPASPANPDPKNEGVRQFITAAALGGMAEVETSQLALKNSKNNYVRDFAALMIKDHGAANTELKSLAAAKGVTLKGLSAGDPVPADVGDKLKKLNTVSGEEFDNQYIQMMIKDHQDAVDLFEDGTKSEDPEVKAYATKYLPALKIHLEKIMSLVSG